MKSFRYFPLFSLRLQVCLFLSRAFHIVDLSCPWVFCVSFFDYVNHSLATEHHIWHEYLIVNREHFRILLRIKIQDPYYQENFIHRDILLQQKLSRSGINPTTNFQWAALFLANRAILFPSCSPLFLVQLYICSTGDRQSQDSYF